MSDQFYLTTPLYYVNSKPHIGHSYTNIAADTLARFHRRSGKEVLFLTGTDEHGQKIAKAAEAEGLSPKDFADKIVVSFVELWKKLDISYDDFIRTTEERHKKAVQEVWKALEARGRLYRASYSGWYCTPDETFWTEGQVAKEEGKILCPDCKRPVERLEEENFFLKMSDKREWLIQKIREAKEFVVLPETRRNEVLGFLENNDLQDLCISRPKSRLQWGIPSPLSDAHVTYVWFDALINYIAACGYGDPAQKKRLEQWWPANVHLIGKDILRHHAVYWPIILEALGLALPRMIFAHGWWVQGGEKMSKSRGNVVDPLDIVDRFGIDAYRYFLLRETPFGSDGTFSEEALTLRFNTDLANDLGNLLHRTLTMCEKYFGGNIPVGASGRYRGDLRADVDGLSSALTSAFAKLDFSGALSQIWSLITRANKTIEEKAPWTLAKQGKTAELEEVIAALCETLKAVAQNLWPFMPRTAEAIWVQLGIGPPISAVASEKKGWGSFEKGGAVKKGNPLFPRIEKQEPKK